MNAGTANCNARIAPATSSANATVKAEKSKGGPCNTGANEYDEWAQKLVNRPIPQLQPNSNNSTNSNNASGTSSGLSVTNLLFQSVNGNNNNSNALHHGGGGGGQGQSTMLIGSDGLPPHQGFDLDSAIGRFTWIVVDEDKYIPALFRLGSTFACVRMIEVSVINTFSNLLPPEIYDGAKLNSHFVTPAEAKLLNYINSFHCDGLYGSQQFTTSDLLVSTDEMEQFYSYLTFSYNVLASGGRNKDNDFQHCGFVEVNKSLIPYAVLEDGEKAVPLFYFEGQVDILKTKAHVLRGWKLAYLKICCRVQGVRKDLITADELLIVHLSDLKSYFPKRTVFTEGSWPVPRSTKSLLLKPTGQTQNHGSHAQFGTGAYSHTRWTRPLTNEGYFSTEKSNSSSLTARTINITGVSGTASASATSNTTASNAAFQNRPQIAVRPMLQQQQQQQRQQQQQQQRQQQLHIQHPPNLVPSTQQHNQPNFSMNYNNNNSRQALYQNHNQQNLLNHRTMPMPASAAAKYIQQLQQQNGINARIQAHPYANVGFSARR